MTQAVQTETFSVVPVLDRDGLQRLYQQHQHGVFAFFANRGYGREECRDLLQQTFLEAWRCRADWSGENADGWLFGIAANLWRQNRRDAGRLKRAGQEVPLETPGADSESGRHAAFEPACPAGTSQPLDLYLEGEEKRFLHAALLELPERMRYCVVLSLRGYKYREIADNLQVSLNTVRKQLFDAREKLRARLGPYFVAGFPEES